nr:seryl-tRNA ligase [Tanacetum cinerariifolium]
MVVGAATGRLQLQSNGSEEYKRCLSKSQMVRGTSSDEQATGMWQSGWRVLDQLSVAYSLRASTDNAKRDHLNILEWVNETLNHVQGNGGGKGRLAQGWRGYMAPEYASRRYLTHKAEVYTLELNLFVDSRGRFKSVEIVDEIIHPDNKWRKRVFEKRQLKTDLNKLTKEIAELTTVYIALFRGRNCLAANNMLEAKFNVKKKGENHEDFGFEFERFCRWCEVFDMVLIGA